MGTGYPSPKVLKIYHLRNNLIILVIKLMDD